MMSEKVTIAQVLTAVRRELALSSETERELLDEIEAHLEDAMAEAVANGLDEEAALLKAVEQFGLTGIGEALQDVHSPWESADAIWACIVPVIATLVLRWVVFAPDGSAIAWQKALISPAFIIVAIVALLVPIVQFRQWQYALISWGFFWGITVIFMVLPTIQSW